MKGPYALILLILWRQEVGGFGRVTGKPEVTIQ
jgi:hypothetical protein